MRKKLSKFGNSRCLIIDKALLNVLDIADDTELEITIQDSSLLITPIHKGKAKKSGLKDKKLEAIVEKVMEKYAPVLEKLSKN